MAKEIIFPFNKMIGYIVDTPMSNKNEEGEVMVVTYTVENMLDGYDVIDCDTEFASIIENIKSGKIVAGRVIVKDGDEEQYVCVYAFPTEVTDYNVSFLGLNTMAYDGNIAVLDQVRIDDSFIANQRGMGVTVSAISFGSDK